MPKCDFNKNAKQLYWNCNSAWVFFGKFAAYFQNTFLWENLWRVASEILNFSFRFSKTFQTIFSISFPIVIRKLDYYHCHMACHKWTHQNNAWNLFRVNNKGIRMTLLTLLWCLYCWLWTDFTNCLIALFIWTRKLFNFLVFLHCGRYCYGGFLRSRDIFRTVSNILDGTFCRNS